MPVDEAQAISKKRTVRIGRAIKEIFYGMAFHAMVRHMRKTKMNLDHFFMLLMMGDTMGIPMLPPYYTLRLMPHVVPQIPIWKRQILKERDLTDMFY